MFPKPKSAPPRMSSKFSSKTNAMKEMEDWAKKDTDPLTGNFETSRMSGQLTDNITEERMLKSKLWELSKERYKFIAQNSYEKKIFLDRIMRRSSAIGRVMSATENENSRGSIINYSGSGNCRNVLLERKNTTKRQDKCSRTNHRTNQPSIHFITSITPEKSSLSQISINNSSPETYEKKPTPKVSLVDKLPNLVTAPVDDSQNGWGLLPVRNGQRRQRSQPRSFNEDPRYAELHLRLCPVVKKTPNLDIYSVVTKIESLHIQPKLLKDGNTKIDKKALAYMRKRGFVFP